jgi:hypothetical protein
VHAKGGSWLANGSADGLVEIEIDPPCHTERSLSTMFRRMKVTELIVSLVDPDGFIAAVQRDGVHPHTGSRKEWSAMERKSSRVVALALTGHALAAAWTWRDIRQQPAQQVRGSKTFWRISSAVNTLGSVGYWLIGRRYRRSQPR